MAIEAMRRWLREPVDGRGLGAFRVMFGLLMLLATIRFWAMGWIDTVLCDPPYHFTYLGFEWVKPLPKPWIQLHFLVIAGSALGIMLGWRTRLMAALFLVSFTWAELIEKAAYLNHYYLVSLLAGILVFLPSDAAYSVRRGERVQVPRWAHVWLRGQVALVYFYAGLAKVGSDWLWRGEPLHTWLQVHADWPLVGEWFLRREVALGMSWAGMCFDLTIWLWLLLPKTRKPAYVIAILFHVSVWLMFPIGVFSWVMLVSATIFFAPDWPARLMQRLGLDQEEREGMTPRGRPARWAPRLMAVWLCVQAALPLRHLAYPGEVNWSERGFRFAWRVMLIEKTGQVEYRVEVTRADGEVERLRVHPREGLTPLQYRMLCTQPDMMLAYAHTLHARYRARYPEAVRVAVFADAFVSLNGAPSRRQVDPEVDLATLSPWTAWWERPGWLLERE